MHQVGEALFGLGFRPELGGPADTQGGVAGEGFIEPDAARAHRVEQPVAEREISDEPSGGFVDVARAEAQDEIAFLDLRACVLMDLSEIRLKFNVPMPARTNCVHDHLTRHTGNRFFAGWINVGDERGVGPIKSPAELVLERERPSVAVWLKHDEHALPAAGSGGRDRCCDLCGVVPVVIDDEIARRFVADFESASGTAKAFERGRRFCRKAGPSRGQE